MNLALLIAGAGALLLASKKYANKLVIEWFSEKFKRRNRLANAYMDQLIRDHKKILRQSQGYEPQELDKMIQAIKDREVNGWPKMISEFNNGECSVKWDKPP